jgi:hypothetical protein
MKNISGKTVHDAALLCGKSNNSKQKAKFGLIDIYHYIFTEPTGV